MRCMSCGANIPPEWVNAIQSNICPGCGNEIMNSATQELLNDITEALERMPNDPQGIAGWFLSNYRFQKMGSGEPVEKFHRKGGGAPGSIDESQLKTDPTYNEFIKRNNAGALVARGEELAKVKHGGGPLGDLASMITSGGIDPYGDDTTSNQPEQEEGADVEDLKAHAAMQAAGLDPFAGNQVGGITDMSQAINPNEIARYLGQNEEAPLKEEIMLSQTQEGRAYLQRDRFKKLKAQDAIAGGGAGGVFRR
jgi:hypothetical protein